MTYPELVNKVSIKVGLPPLDVDKIYKLFWLFIRKHIEVLPLKEDLTYEQFSLLRTNFNIPSLGKLNCTYDRMLGVKEKFKYIKKIRSHVENKED